MDRVYGAHHPFKGHESFAIVIMSTTAPPTAYPCMELRLKIADTFHHCLYHGNSGNSIVHWLNHRRIIRNHLDKFFYHDETGSLLITFMA